MYRENDLHSAGEAYTFCKYTTEGRSIFFAQALPYVTNNMLAGTTHVQNDCWGHVSASTIAGYKHPWDVESP